MLSEENIKRYLEDEFHVKFLVEKNNVFSFKILLDGTNHESFFVSFSIKDDIRLTIEAEPDKYGQKFLEIINHSSNDKRKIFCEYWKELGENKMLVRINALPIDPNGFLVNQTEWKTFNLRYSVSPYYCEGDNKDLKVLSSVSNIIAMVLSLVDYTIEGYKEGATTDIHCNHYERNPVNRQICLLTKGYKCSVCGFDFEETYGDLGKQYIEVHHSIPVSTMEEGHIVNPIEELFPVCSNCHSMIHRKNPPYSIEELRGIINKKKNEN